MIVGNMAHSDKSENGQTIAQAFLEHKSVLSAYLAQKLLSQSDIDDLLQDIFEQAYIAESRQDIVSPKGYLFGVARNLLSQRFRKNSKRMSIEINDANISEIAEDFIPPENIVFYKLKMDILNEAIKSLPPQCQRVFVLRKIHGLSQKKIASKMKISTSTVERHITIALARLNAIMTEKGYSDDRQAKAHNNVRRLK